jgi:hypothetical protein
LVNKTLWCRFLKLLRQSLKSKHVRGGPAKSGSFLKWGKLWKGISSKEYRLQGWSKIRSSEYGFFEGIKLCTWSYLIKPGLAAGSLFFSQHEERMKLFERAIYPLKKEKLYRANPKSVGVWKKIPRFWSRQSVKAVTKPQRRNTFGTRQIPNTCNLIKTKTLKGKEPQRSNAKAKAKV